MTNEKALRIINSADVYDLAAAYSNYAVHVLTDPDGALYPMGDFDEITAGFTHTELAKKLFYGCFSPFADFFTFDGYGHLESVNASDVADFIIYRLSAADLTEIATLL
nr:MAG TPA: hypothetical protein [Caudoviricetes sp.]